jgi:hypothetical protein
VQAPTPHAPPLQAFLVDFSQQSTRFSHLLAMVCFQASPRALGGCIDGVCGAGDSPPPDLPREASRSRSAPEKSVQFGPDGAPSPVKTSITRWGANLRRRRTSSIICLRRGRALREAPSREASRRREAKFNLRRDAHPELACRAVDRSSPETADARSRGGTASGTRSPPRNRFER